MLRARSSGLLLALSLLLVLISSTEAIRFKPLQALKKIMRGRRQPITPHLSVETTVPQRGFHDSNPTSIPVRIMNGAAPVSVLEPSASSSLPMAYGPVKGAILLSAPPLGRFSTVLKKMAIKSKPMITKVVSASMAYLRKDFLRPLYALLGLRPPTFLLATLGPAGNGEWVILLASSVYGGSKLAPKLVPLIRKLSEPALVVPTHPQPQAELGPTIKIGDVFETSPPPPSEPEALHMRDLGFMLRDTLILVAIGVLLSRSRRRLLYNRLSMLWSSSSHVGRSARWWSTGSHSRQIVARGQAAAMTADLRMQLCFGVAWRQEWLIQRADMLKGHIKAMAECNDIRSLWDLKHSERYLQDFWGKGLDVLEKYLKMVSASEDRWGVFLKHADKMRQALTNGAIEYRDIVFMEGAELDKELQKARIEHCGLLGVDCLTASMFGVIVRTGNGHLAHALRGDMGRAEEEAQRRQAVLDVYEAGHLRKLW